MKPRRGHRAPYLHAACKSAERYERNSVPFGHVNVRRGENESRFRDVNEALERRSLRAPSSDLTFEILCECDEETCTEAITVSYFAYESVRDAPTMFIVAPGHADPEIERVVSTTADYDVVEKRGDAALSALVNDPRA